MAAAYKMLKEHNYSAVLEQLYPLEGGGDCFEDDPTIKDFPRKDSLDRKDESNDDDEERNETFKNIESAEKNTAEDMEELEENCDSSEKDTDQPIASNCNQALGFKDAVKLLRRKNCGSVSRIPPKPESGTVWRFRTDRCIKINHHL